MAYEAVDEFGYTNDDAAIALRATPERSAQEALKDADAHEDEVELPAVEFMANDAVLAYEELNERAAQEAEIAVSAVPA